MTTVNFIKLFAFIVLASLLGSCQKSAEIELTQSFDGVDAELAEHFANFEKEAAKRGMTIDLAAAGITGSIEKIHTPGLVGICNHRAVSYTHLTLPTTPYV